MPLKTLLKELYKIKQMYLKDGIEIIGIFGSVAKQTNDDASDLDILYKIKKDVFFKKYKDGFSQIIKLDEIKNYLQKNFKTKVDFTNFDNINKYLKNEINKDIVYV